MKLYTPLLVLPLLLLPAVPAGSQEDDATTAIDDVPHITIVGTARRDVAPDLATLSLGVVNEAPGAAEAAQANADAAQGVVAAAQAAGVVVADIATRALTLEQTFDEVTDAAGRVTGRRPRGFAASHGYAIRVHDLAKLGTLVQNLVARGANRFDGVTFSLADPQPALDRLAAEAVGNAKRQAALVAEAAGVRLGRVLLVERPDETGGRPTPFAGVMRAAAPVPVEAGMQTLSAAMEVTFSVE